MIVIGYVRVSTEEQANEGVSLEAQRDRILQYADLYGLHLGAIYEDAGASASTLERPGLQAALKELGERSGEAQITGLIVAKLDRLTRKLRDLLWLVDVYFNDLYSLLSVAEQLDPRTASGRLVMNLLAAVAQWELETIGERTKEALRHKRERGEFTGGDAPYGFCLVGAKKVPDSSRQRGYRLEGGKLERVEVEQMVIAKARDLYRLGFSLRRVAAALGDWNLPPRGGGEWSPQQIKRLLGNGA